MASISTSKGGLRTVQFVDTDGKRKSIRLGKVTKRQAETVKLHLERLVSRKITGHSIPDDTSHWLTEIEGKLVDDLAKHGLIDPPAKKVLTQLKAFLDSFINEFSPTVKPGTVVTWKQTRRLLLEHFAADTPLNEITEGHAIQWRNFLTNRHVLRAKENKRPLSESTIRRRCGCARQLFEHALSLELISKNPFVSKKLPTSLPRPEQKYHVSADEARRIMDKLPNAEWRLLFAMARWGGVRIPSEVQQLEWRHIDVETNRILIKSPKTEHHAGHEQRTIPIFPELVELIEDARETTGDGPLVFPMLKRKSNAYCRKPILAAIEAAGIKPWDKLFVALRATRDTELREHFPSHVVDAWIGHDEAVAKKNYLQVTDEHFEKAVQKAVQYPAVMARTDSHRDSAELAESLENKGKRCNRSVQQKTESGRYWPTTPAFSSGNSNGLPKSGAESGAVDSELARVADQIRAAFTPSEIAQLIELLEGGAE